jgi:hypothetical protein
MAQSPWPTAATPSFYAAGPQPIAPAAPTQRNNMITGLAPWLQQAQPTGAPMPFQPMGGGSPAPQAGGEPWWAAQLQKSQSDRQALVDQMKQAELLKKQAADALAASQSMAGPGYYDSSGNYYSGNRPRRERLGGDGDGDGGGGDGGEGDE